MLGGILMQVLIVDYNLLETKQSPVFCLFVRDQELGPEKPNKCRLYPVYIYLPYFIANWRTPIGLFMSILRCYFRHKIIKSFFFLKRSYYYGFSKCFYGNKFSVSEPNFLRISLGNLIPRLFPHFLQFSCHIFYIAY